jgi:hypothetical protein
MKLLLAFLLGVLFMYGFYSPSVKECRAFHDCCFIAHRDPVRKREYAWWASSAFPGTRPSSAMLTVSDKHECHTSQENPWVTRVECRCLMPWRLIPK